MQLKKYCFTPKFINPDAVLVTLSFNYQQLVFNGTFTNDYIFMLQEE